MAESDSHASGSPLSDIDSDELEEPGFDRRVRDDSTISADSSPTGSTSTPRRMPASKRRRTGAGPYDHATPTSYATPQIPRSPSPESDVSEDTDGSVPTSPSFANLPPTHPLSTAHNAAQQNPDDPEMADANQITTCLWADCTDREQQNMDNLVNHINEAHIEPKQKKYTCEWETCNRKSASHASAYALRAHMRSHTKEKPFMCQLPECDRSFTRSDALAKHMRTVHETEALRPSDPVPRGHTGGISNGVAAGGNNTSNGNGTLKRIKLIMGGVSADKKNSIIGELPPLPMRQVPDSVRTHQHLNNNSNHVDSPAIPNIDDPSTNTTLQRQDELDLAIDIDTLPFQIPVPPDYYPPDIYAAMDNYERALPPSQYFRLLRRQTHWAEEESAELVKELEQLVDMSEELDHDGSNVNGDVKLPLNLKSNDPTIVASFDRRRRRDWLKTENLLDEVARREVERVWGMVVDQGEDVNGDDGTFGGLYDREDDSNDWKGDRKADGEEDGDIDMEGVARKKNADRDPWKAARKLKRLDYEEFV